MDYADCLRKIIFPYFAFSGKPVEITKAMVPILIASRLGHVESFKLLKDNGANLSVADQEWNTPLHWAIKEKHTEIIKVSDHI